MSLAAGDHGTASGGVAVVSVSLAAAVAMCSSSRDCEPAGVAKRAVSVEGRTLGVAATPLAAVPGLAGSETALCSLICLTLPLTGRGASAAACACSVPEAGASVAVVATAAVGLEAEPVLSSSDSSFRTELLR